MAVYVENIDKLSYTFNSLKHASRGKTLHSPLSNNSPHIVWTKASMGIKSWIFLKDGKPVSKKQAAAQNEWIIDIGAVQHVWRILKRAGSD